MPQGSQGGQKQQKIGRKKQHMAPPVRETRI
jgi:hypothetical protein